MNCWVLDCECHRLFTRVGTPPDLSIIYDDRCLTDALTDVCTKCVFYVPDIMQATMYVYMGPFVSYCAMVICVIKPQLSVYGPIILGSLMRSIFFVRHSSLCGQTMVSLGGRCKTIQWNHQRDSHWFYAGGLESSPYTFGCRAQNRQSIFGLSLAWETPDLYLLR